MDWTQLAVITAVVSGINGATVWAVTLLLRRESGDIRSRIDLIREQDRDQDEDIQKLRTELAEHKLDVAANYIHRDDFVIWSARCEQKIDAIWAFLHEAFTHVTGPR